MNNLMGNTSMPNYVKITATVILALTYVSALGVAVAVYISAGPQAQLPSIVTFILGTGMTLAIGALNLHQGASLLESPSPVPVTTNPPAPSSDTPPSQSSEGV